MTYAFALLCIAITIPIIIRETRKSRQDRLNEDTDSYWATPSGQPAFVAFGDRAPSGLAPDGLQSGAFGDLPNVPRQLTNRRN